MLFGKKRIELCSRHLECSTDKNKGRKIQSVRVWNLRRICVFTSRIPKYDKLNLTAGLPYVCVVFLVYTGIAKAFRPPRFIRR